MYLLYAYDLPYQILQEKYNSIVFPNVTADHISSISFESSGISKSKRIILHAQPSVPHIARVSACHFHIPIKSNSLTQSTIL